jgi:Tol biopolymer transport system component
MLCPAAAGAAFPGANGKIVFSRSGNLYTVLPDGSKVSEVPQRTADQQRNYYPAWSPDGTRLMASGSLLQEDDDDPGSFHWSHTNIHLFAPDGWGFQRLDTPNQHVSSMPTWSPDGSRIAYASDELAQARIYTARPDGTDVRLVLDPTGPGGVDPAWSPDGDRIAFWTLVDAGMSDLFTVRPDGSDLRRLELPGPASEPAWSPDGKWIAFAGGTSESNIYVVPAAGGQARQLTHSGQDSVPAWAPDGSAIVFASNRDADPGTSRQDLYLINADGSAERRLTTIGCWQCDPDWQPLPDRSATASGGSQRPRTRRPTPPGLSRPVHLTEFKLSRHRFSRRVMKHVRVSVRLDAPGFVTFRLARREAIRYLPAGTSELRLGRLFPRPLKPGRYRLSVDSGKQGSILRVGFRVRR